jgi:hypothetical protein
LATALHPGEALDRAQGRGLLAREEHLARERGAVEIAESERHGR